MLSIFRYTAAGLFALCLAMPAQAARLTSLKVTETAELGIARPDFPQPSDQSQLFYLQRSTNANTVVYAARFDAAGNLDARNPVAIYWRRYDTTGERKPLRRIERFLAFGVNVRPRPSPGEFTLIPRASTEHALLLRQTGPYRAEILANIGGRAARLSHIYLEIDETGLLPTVRKITVFGADLNSDRAISETFAVSGGAFRP